MKTGLGKAARIEKAPTGGSGLPADAREPGTYVHENNSMKLKFYGTRDPSRLRGRFSEIRGKRRACKSPIRTIAIIDAGTGMEIWVRGPSRNRPQGRSKSVRVHAISLGPKLQGLSVFAQGFMIPKENNTPDLGCDQDNHRCGEISKVVQMQSEYFRIRNGHMGANSISCKSRMPSETLTRSQCVETVVTLKSTTTPRAYSTGNRANGESVVVLHRCRAWRADRSGGEIGTRRGLCWSMTPPITRPPEELKKKRRDRMGHSSFPIKRCNCGNGRPV